MKMAPTTTTTTFITAALCGALNKRKVYLSILCLSIVALWNTHSVTAAPAKFDSLDSTFPLDLQPPVFEATASAPSTPSPPSPQGNTGATTTVDSYGNPIESVKPVETPDGRKVVSAHGLQFVIPSYASGITELKTPADDLLPPFVDPIVVALPVTTAERFSTYPGQTSAEVTTSVDIESVPLVEFKTPPAINQITFTPLSSGLPNYILELNDPDIGGPVTYQPSDDKRNLNIIAWDLLPPVEDEDGGGKFISHTNRVSPTTGHNFVAHASLESSHHNTQRPQHRGGVSFASSTISATTPRTVPAPRPTTPLRITTTTTTTTPRTTKTTTRRTTTPRTTTTTTTTTPEPDTSEFFKLEAGDSYTLPPWLLDIDDPELDVAVTYEAPADLNEYNITIHRDLLPPFEPYTDLSDIPLTSLQSFGEPTTTVRSTTTLRTTTTPRTTATPRTTTTSTTRRPHLTTSKVHWVRVDSTSPRPTASTFNYKFTSLSPFSSATNFAQRTPSIRSTSTAKPQTVPSFYNRQFSSNIPQTDKFGSSTEEVATRPGNPFLSSSTSNDGRYKPQSTTRITATTTTTTTTTPPPEFSEKNPFEATIPPWLQDFDYPGLGPGVPFVYDPNEDENAVDKDILPPSTAEDPNQTNPTFASHFSNSQTPQSFTNQLTSSAAPFLTSTSSSSIPSSIVTIPHTSTQTNLPAVFVPSTSISADGTISADKSDDILKQTSSSFNKHFAAPFDPATSSNALTGGDPKKVPLSADRESFPPFNGIVTGSPTAPTKTTFSKSEDGKVITNNIFLSGGVGAPAAKPIGSLQFLGGQEKNTLTTQSSSLTTSAAASGFVTASSSSFTSDSSRYTGRFGGPPGVLAPQQNGFATAASSTVTKTYTKPFATTTFGVTSPPARATKFTGSFGGPPGILRPYDNVKQQ